MSAAAWFLQLCGGEPSEGVFVGAFLSMSSTAVVIPFVHCVSFLFVHILGKIFRGVASYFMLFQKAYGKIPKLVYLCAVTFYKKFVKMNFDCFLNGVEK